MTPLIHAGRQAGSSQSYLQQSGGRVTLQTLPHLVDFIQQEHRVVNPNCLQAIDDATGHAADVGAPAESKPQLNSIRRRGREHSGTRHQEWERPCSSPSNAASPCCDTDASQHYQTQFAPYFLFKSGVSTRSIGTTGSNFGHLVKLKNITRKSHSCDSYSLRFQDIQHPVTLIPRLLVVVQSTLLAPHPQHNQLSRSETAAPG